MGNNAEFFADVHNLEPAVTLSPDWLVGEDLDLRGTGVLGFRNMADPEEDDDPDHYSERHLDGADNGGVHSNSAISNHAYYLLVNGGMNASCAAPATHNAAHCSDADTQDNNLNVVGIGLADAEQIFFLTMTALPEIATMCQTRLATTAVAAALFGGSSTERQSTKDAWVAVGLTDSVCS
jgi:thermolysin